MYEPNVCSDFNFLPQRDARSQSALIKWFIMGLGVLCFQLCKGGGRISIFFKILTWANKLFWERRTWVFSGWPRKNTFLLWGEGTPGNALVCPLDNTLMFEIPNLRQFLKPYLRKKERKKRKSRWESSRAQALPDVKKIGFVLWLGATPGSAQGLLLALILETTPGCAWGLYVVPWTKCWSGTCKANPLAAALSFQHECQVK